MDNIYTIQLNKLREWLIPTMLRTPIALAIAKAGYKPLLTLYNDFVRFRKNKFYDIQINFQVCWLENFLNDRFDAKFKRIHIEDAEQGDPIFIHKREEAKPFVLKKRSEAAPQYIYTRGESIGDLMNDFIIYVPEDVVINENELRAMLSKKICGKRYKIQNY